MEVFSFGNGDFLFQIFSAVRGIMGDGSFGTLIRIAILLGFLFMLYQLLFSLNILTISTGVVRHYIFIVVIVGILFTPKTDVVIRDEIKNTQVVVNNVPYGVGLFAHIFTTIERGITNMMENYFSTPSDIRFNQAGYAFSVILLDSFRDVVPKDPYFKLTLDDYITNCFFHDVLWGDKNLQAIVFSNSIWADFSPANSANKFTKIYSQASPSGEATTCSTAYGSLSGSFNTASNDATTALNNVLQIDVAAKTPHVTNYLLGISMSAHQAIQQSMVSNALKSSFARTAMYTGESAAAVPYATGLAEISQRSSWMVAGELSKKYIPIMRQVLEAFVYGLFPLLFLMMLTPLGGRYLRVYITLLIWLLLWSPLFAILNLIVNVRANGVLSASYGYFSIGSMPYVYQSASDLTAMAGYMAWMVPMVALAIAKGSEHALASMTQSVASSASFTAKSAASTISTPEGVQRIAAHQGLIESTQAYGASAVMQGMAASKIFSIQQGMATRGVGMAGTSTIADTEMSGRHMDAQALENISKKHGLPVEQAQTVMASDKYQQAIAGAKERRAFAEEFAKSHNTTPEAGYQFLAETNMAQNRAIHDAWGGQAGAYANFLKTGYELSAGQQKGVVAAAQAAGVSIKDYGQMTSFMEEMRKVGALDKFMSGEISSNDLRNMGAVGLLNEQGMAVGSQKMADALGISVAEARAMLTTREGLNQFAKIEMRDMANRMLGGDGSDKSYYEYVKGVHASDSKTLAQGEAQNLQDAMRRAGYTEFSARAGDKTTFAFNPTTGKFTMAHTERGGRSNTYDVGAIDKGKRHRIGDDIKTGNEIERVDINRATRDHSTNVREGHFERTGTDIERLDRNVSTVDKGSRIPADTGTQMALSYNPSMYKNVVNAYEGNNFRQTEAEMVAVAASLSAGLNSYYGHTGKMSEQAFGRAFLEAGISLPKLNLGLTGQAGVHLTSEKDQRINLVTKAFHEAQAHALKEGTRLGYSGEQLQAHVAAKVGQFAHALLKHANYDRGYGASGLYNDAVDAGKPLPLAPENVKNERIEKFHNEMKRKITGK